MKITACIAILLTTIFAASVYAVTLSEVEQMTNQAALARVAANDEDPNARYAAVKKITEQAALAKLVVEDKHSEITDYALRKLTDPSMLAKLATNYREPGVRLVSWYVRSVAAGRLTNQAVLANVAVNDEDYRVRLAAVSKLKDQVLLTNLAFNDEDPDIRCAAVRNITDQAVLADLAANYRDPIAPVPTPPAAGRSASGKKLGVSHGSFADRAMPGRVAGTRSSRPFCATAVDIRLTAVANLKDQSTLAKLAMQDKNKNIRIAAVKRLTDQTLLANVAVNDKSREVREAAEERLAKLKKLAEGKKDQNAGSPAK